MMDIKSEILEEYFPLP